MGWSRSYLQKVRVQTLGIHKYRKQSAPFYMEEEEHEAKKRHRKMMTEMFTPGTNNLIVVDDEHHIYLDQSNNVSYMYYNSTSRNVAPKEIKTHPQRKFCPKLMVWLAITMKRRSEPYIAPHKKNTDQKVYLKECLEKRLIPFLKMAYPKGNAIFWPDKARAHYARTVQTFLREQKIKCVEYNLNPMKVPQTRSVETYWAELDRRLSLYRKPAKDLQILKQRIRETIKRIPESYLQSVMAGVRTKLRKIADWGSQAA